MKHEVQITAVGEGTDLSQLRAATDVASEALSALGMAVVVGMVHRPEEEDIPDAPSAAGDSREGGQVIALAKSAHPGQYL